VPIIKYTLVSINYHCVESYLHRRKLPCKLSSKVTDILAPGNTQLNGTVFLTIDHLLPMELMMELNLLRKCLYI